MATKPEGFPLDSGPRPRLDSSSSLESFSLFLKALSASRSCSGEGEPGGGGGVGSDIPSAPCGRFVPTNQYIEGYPAPPPLEKSLQFLLATWQPNKIRTTVEPRRRLSLFFIGRPCFPRVSHGHPGPATRDQDGGSCYSGPTEPFPWIAVLPPEGSTVHFGQLVEVAILELSEKTSV